MAAQSPQAAQAARFIPPRDGNRAQAVIAWAAVVVLLADAVVFAVVLMNSYRVAKESSEVFTQLALSGGECRRAVDAGPVRYEHQGWKASFEIPDGHVGVERLVDAETKAVEVAIAQRRDPAAAQATGAYADTSVRVRVGPATGFARYLTKPYADYGGYRRFTAAARAAVTYADPARENDGIQVIVVDDTRNGREISLEYSGLLENAEPMAYDILKTLRLSPRDETEIVVKPGWRVFSQEPVRFQYPDDYRVETPMVGRINVKGKGGRLEIAFAYGIDQSGRRRLTGAPPDAASGGPSEYFDLQYDVDVRVAFYYAGDSTAYDRGILKEIASTISLTK